MKIQVVDFWVLTPCSDVVVHDPEDGGFMVLRKVCVLLHYYTVSQPIRPRSELLGWSN